jgi:hypothetical protein
MQSLFVVFGGELVDPSTTEFRNPKAIHVAGVFDDYQEAYNAWKSHAWQTVDNALMRYFISPIVSVIPTEA